MKIICITAGGIGLNLRQLSYFIAIAEEGQITRAAKKLHMAQPPLSQQLKLLEESLGTVLFERTGRNIELTEAGKVLYQRAQKLLQDVDDTSKEIQEIGMGLSGTLSIGSVETNFFHLSRRLRPFHEQYPNVQFRLFSGDSYRLANRLREREIELAIIQLPLNLDDFHSIPLPADQFVFVTQEDGIERKSISLEEISKLPLMVLYRESGEGLYEMIVNAFKLRGLEPNIIFQCPDPTMLLSLVYSGVASGILPKSSLISYPIEGVKAIDIEHHPIESESAVIWLKDAYLSKSARHLLETFHSNGQQSITSIGDEINVMN